LSKDANIRAQRWDSNPTAASGDLGWLLHPVEPLGRRDRIAIPVSGRTLAAFD